MLLVTQGSALRGGIGCVTPTGRDPGFPRRARRDPPGRVARRGSDTGAGLVVPRHCAIAGATRPCGARAVYRLAASVRTPNRAKLVGPRCAGPTGWTYAPTMAAYRVRRPIPYASGITTCGQHGSTIRRPLAPQPCVRGHLGDKALVWIIRRSCRGTLGRTFVRVRV